ncbi:MAG: prepilin-type N-terminal cleavage/methylation domain-containing protein [Candidatus Sumerlaeia bacterium]|nr:prepilin-type N-terminal cleavage/methylation domain-containing protein [Candidatus Sumerlaeia bacterium]
MNSPKNAFTLIELLIVVAIIAILAAIAVPNFLEAQTRAKVSRVKSDMRSLATAIEAYRVDNNRYPTPGGEDGRPIVLALAAPILDVDDEEHGEDEFVEARITTLITTPIAYITSLPSDPFQSQDGEESPLLHYSPLWYPVAAEGDAGRDEFLEYVAGFGKIGGDSVAYFMLSHGPDLDHDDDTEAQALYDPTNGSVSNGDVVFFGPGTGFLN